MKRASTLVLHLRDTETLCGPGKTILETIRINDDPRFAYCVGGFETERPNEYLEHVARWCPTVALSGTRTRLARDVVDLARWVSRSGVGIVHAHDVKTDAYGYLAARLAGVPAVTTAHGYVRVSAKSMAYSVLDKALRRRMELVLVVSETMKNEWLSAGFPGERLRVVKNCIVLDRYPFHSRPERWIRERTLAKRGAVIGCIGRLSAEKGHARALRAFARVLRFDAHVTLMIAGDGPERGRLEALSEDLGINERVTFLGHRKNIHEVYEALDVLVLPSRSEGLPNVILEAMALGIPVVATAAGGTPELVRHGETGYLAGADVVRDLAQGVLDTLRDPKRTAEQTARARTFAEREHDMPRLVERTHAIYRQLLEANVRDDRRRGHPYRKAARRRRVEPTLSARRSERPR